MDSIVSNKHNGCSLTYCRQQFILDFHDAFICFAVQVDDGKVEVWLDEIVSSKSVGKLPVTHGKDVEGVAHSRQLQVSGWIDVQEQVAHVVAAVRGYIVIDELRTLCLHISIGKDKFRTNCLVEAHSEDASLCQLAFLADAIVILLLVCQFEGINCAAIGNVFRQDFLERHEVSRLGAKEQCCSSWNRDGIKHTHRHFCLYGAVEVHCAHIAGCDVALCLTGFRGNDVEVVGVAVEHKEHLVAVGVVAHRGVHFVAFLIGDFEVEAIVGAEYPIGILYLHI